MIIRVSRIERVCAALFLGLTLTACDIAQNYFVAPDGTITIEQEHYLDAQACEIADRALGPDGALCGQVEGGDRLATEYDAASDRHLLLPPNGRMEESSVADFVAKNEWASLSGEGRILVIRAPKGEYQNLSRGPASVERQPQATPRDIEGLGPVEAYDGHEAVITLTALEILETNGEISEDGKTVTFRIPALFVVFGMGDPVYDEIYIKARF